MKSRFSINYQTNQPTNQPTKQLNVDIDANKQITNSNIALSLYLHFDISHSNSDVHSGVL